MNSAQIHLALNHVPLFCSVAGAIILAIGMIKKDQRIKLLALTILVVGGLFTIPVFLSGEGTEELVEKFPGVTDNAIEAHEEMAKIALWIIVAMATVALGGILLQKNQSIFKSALILSIILSLVAFGAMAQTAHLGGKIRHSELGLTANNQESEDKQAPDKTGDDD